MIDKFLHLKFAQVDLKIILKLVFDVLSFYEVMAKIKHIIDCFFLDQPLMDHVDNLIKSCKDFIL